jgi:peptidyl-prolyl cis-trans isomerase C
LLWASIPLLYAAVTAGSAFAQAMPPADPSPLAPGDLKRPIFDTQTSAYDTSNAQAKSAGTVVAEVDGRAVTLGDVADAIKLLPPNMAALPFDDLFASIVANLVRQQALVIRAQQQGLDEDPVIRRKLKAATDQAMANALLQHEIEPTISEQALLERYKQDYAGKPGPDEVHIRVIMAHTEEAATALIGELRGGADFAALAKRSSVDTTASTGGDVGFVRRDGVTPEVGAAAFALPAGQFTPFAVLSNGAWFIVKVEERRQGSVPGFAAVRNKLEQAMMKERVGDVVAKAMAGVTVREYSINGKEFGDPASRN